MLCLKSDFNEGVTAMSTKQCPKCGRQYASSYRSCPYCDRRGKRSRQPTFPELVTDFIRQHGERIFLVSSCVFILIAILGVLLTRCSKEDEKPKEDEKLPQQEVQQPEDPPEPAALPLTISQSSAALLVGETASLTISGGTGTPVWASSDPNVASVSGGTVTAAAAGTATITVTCGTEKAACTVTVTVPEPEVEVYLNRTDFTIRRQDGDTFQMQVKVKETRKLYEGTVAWTSADPSVVTVSETGLVTRVGRGNTVITATIGSKTLECIVRVS